MSSILYTNGIKPALRRLYDALEDRKGIHRAMADSAKVLTADHFATLTETQRNPYGKRASFWPRMIRSLRAGSDREDGKLSMGREVAQRYFGGTIKPTGGREALTIPVNPKAYGKRATDPSLGKLEPIRQTAGETTVALLVKAIKKSALFEIYFILVKQVTQRPDPSVLPTREQYGNAVRHGVDNYLGRFGFGLN